MRVSRQAVRVFDAGDVTITTMSIWEVKEVPGEIFNDDRLADYSPLIRRLLVLRGLNDPTRAESFLSPDYDNQLHDPFLIPDMDKATERLTAAFLRQEKIGLFGDYDADGIPGLAILASFFNDIEFADFTVLIPDRQTDGYGLTVSHVEELASRGAKLIITVDCGTNDHEAIALARRQGIDVIVIDHHLVHQSLPPAVAILNPKRQDSKYPFPDLAASGVVFKLIQALVVRHRLLTLGREKWYLDLVAIATIADLVPLKGENRVLTSFGLKVLKKTLRPGLSSLLAACRISPGTVSEDDVSFLVAPRLNAASRMSHGDDAYHLLVARHHSAALDLTRHLETKNKERKVLVATILNDAHKRLDQSLTPSFILLGDDSWPAGVLGLGAGKLAEHYNCPVFLWGGLRRGVVKGSVRSDGQINVVELMSLAGGPDLFVDFGGHAMAGGFTIAKDKLPLLTERLSIALETAKQIPQPPLLADAELSLDDVNQTLWNDISRLAPFGKDNPKPLFLFRNSMVVKTRSFGGNAHLELICRGLNGAYHSAVSFFVPKTNLPDNRVGYFNNVIVSPGEHLHLLASVEVSSFFSGPKLRLRLADIKKPVK